MFSSYKHTVYSVLYTSALVFLVLERLKIDMTQQTIQIQSITLTTAPYTPHQHAEDKGDCQFTICFDTLIFPESVEKRCACAGNLSSFLDFSGPDKVFLEKVASLSGSI